MRYIQRSLEQRVREMAGMFKCVLVTGARQTGKSTMLKKLFGDMRYVSFDDPYIEDQARESPHMFMSLNRPPVIFDEVQRVPELFRYIKAACDASDERGMYILSGSQPFELMQGASESLSGRVGIVELAGLSLRELAGDTFRKPFLPAEGYVSERAHTAKAPDDLWGVIHNGGYPGLYGEKTDWNAYYSSYVKTYLERDVRSLSAVHDLGDFRRFMTAAAARTGQVVNYANIADETGKDQTTIKRWMDILEASGVVYLLEPYASSALKRAIKAPKLYFRDTGLAAYLTRWLTSETLATGAMSGAFFETFVVSEILKSYSNAGVDYRYCVSYYRGKDKVKTTSGDTVSVRESEIDLVLEEGGILYPVEIKRNVRAKAEAALAFTVLDKVPDRRRGTGAVICMCPQPGMLRENIFQLPVWYV